MNLDRVVVVVVVNVSVVGDGDGDVAAIMQRPREVAGIVDEGTTAFVVGDRSPPAVGRSSNL